MLLDIKPVKTSANCFVNNLIIQIADFFSIDYRPFFLRYLNDYLIWKETDDFLNMNPCYTDKTKMSMEKLIGLSWSTVEIQDRIDALVLIKDNINKGYPVGLKINEKYLPWSKHKRDNKREILIIGYNTNDIIYCADGYMSQKVEELNIGVLDNLTILHILSIQNNFCLNTNDLLQSVLYNVTAEDIEKRKLAMWEFADKIYHINYSKLNRLSYDEISHKLFIYLISHYISNRVYFVKYLKDLSVQYNIFKNVLFDNIMIIIENNLAIFKSLIIKSIMINSNKYKDKIILSFNNYLDNEYELINNIRQYQELVLMDNNYVDGILKCLNKININIPQNREIFNEDLSQYGMNSIEFIKLIVELEKMFDIEYPDEALIITKSNTVNKIVNVISESKK